ncbi:hypothetical protein [Bythopirellula polymerisocia]|uniref:Uncharacterized protein n=1 Tax=Bythopirellula polymerisocia TaxID=2528003 RepID=A0A5C6D3N3_9BACT|nr:hypothetical protein [Bythopirellula polymerisocia]TWU29469.1 hypothetical protein Pla144_02470 [Bythopirellula polymerisocia]
MFHNRMEKRLRFESLEKKQLLAADLTVAVIDGDLVITGDAEPNSFVLRSGVADGGQFKFELGIAGDTINNEVPDAFNTLYSGITGNVLINTGSGDDSVRIFGGSNTDDLDPLIFPGDLRIDLGDGDDELAMGSSLSNPDSQLPLSISDDLIVEGGTGDDYFEFTAVRVADDFTVVDTQGSNTLTLPFPIYQDSDESTSVGDDFTIVMGSGNDDISINRAIVNDNLLVSVDGGDDIVNGLLTTVSGSTLVSLGNGNDFLSLSLFDAGRTLSVVGSGTNDIGLGEVTATSFITIVTTNGNDVVGIDASSTGILSISTGDGNDEVEIFDSAFELLFVKLGKGDDVLALEEVVVSKLALLNGGQGYDSLVDLGGNDINLELDLAFEMLEEFVV